MLRRRNPVSIDLMIITFDRLADLACVRSGCSSTLLAAFDHRGAGTLLAAVHAGWVVWLLIAAENITTLSRFRE